MKLFRKGISPLIATVLIIGFTVALAAIIMTWGTTFSKGIQKGTETTANEQMICAQEVLFNLGSACNVSSETGSGIVKLTISNDGSRAIKSFTARFYKDPNNVVVNSTFLTAPLDAFGIVQKNVSISLNPGQVKQIDLLPVVEIEGRNVPCPTTIDKLGNAEGTDYLLQNC
ncbi:MAG: hypothetical protein QME12_03680 [Nanoarchaeota archaeon]|nr:hypothetical protein [Nanoarchaeota archaeon]